MTLTRTGLSASTFLHARVRFARRFSRDRLPRRGINSRVIRRLELTFIERSRRPSTRRLVELTVKMIARLHATAIPTKEYFSAAAYQLHPL